VDGFNNNNIYFKTGFLVKLYKFYTSLPNISDLQINMQTMNKKYELLFLYDFKISVVFI